jgi:hypothetical protein
MQLKSALKITSIAASMLVSTVAATLSASASPINWTMWSGATLGSPAGGSAQGSMGGINVTYTGEVQNLIFNYPSWGPAPTFSGGTVGNPPPSAGGIIQLTGGPKSATDTITFSQAVTNPVMAIWSLGAGDHPASFIFNSSEPFSIESGGPSNEYGGSGLSLVPYGVSGAEGNGTIQFLGTFTSISWTNPQFEYWYGFTVGDPTPLPTAWLMLLSAFAGLGFITYRGTKKGPAFAAA